MRRNTNDSVETRRHFLRLATSSVGVVLTAPMIASLITSCETDETQPNAPGKTYDVNIADYPELATVGSITSAYVAGLNADNPIFISRVATSAFVVFTTVCTHAGCLVELPASASDNCRCPCHGAEYSSTDGSVLRQPSTGSARDLPKFASSYNATTNILTITG